MLVTIGELVTQVLPECLLLLAADIIDLLVLEDALQDAIACLAVHLQDFVSYDFAHTFLRQVVESTPVMVFVHEIVLHALDWVLVHIRPLPTHR